LYVVATGLGGWSASRILHLVQAKQGVASQPAFVPQGFLQLSPFFNLSHLVRGVPVLMEGGGVLLPAYFEMGIKYPVAIRLDANGELVQSRDAMVRMAGNLKSLQPSVVVASESNATAYLRDNSDQKKLRFIKTTDSGKSWQDVPTSQGEVGEAGADFVINPDSSALALRLGDQTLLIHNPQTSGRHRLVIEGSKDGLRGFKRLATLEYEPPQLDGIEFNEYSYPSAVVIGKQLHVSYTYQKHFIRHVVLEAAK
jgi:predicted neuraminidase